MPLEDEKLYYIGNNEFMWVKTGDWQTLDRDRDSKQLDRVVDAVLSISHTISSS